MEWIERYYEKTLLNTLKPGKVLALYGPRRAGKTSLVQRCISKYKGKIYSGTGDDRTLRDILTSQNLARIVTVFKGYDLLFIDEAQRIEDVGYSLKLITDHLPDVAILTTGSSSFNLASRIGEPLTGRQITCLIYPIAVMELAAQYGGMDVFNRLEEFLILGTYPETLIAQNFKEKSDFLIAIRDAYLMKDILELENLRNASKLNNLLKLVAFQIGKQVSLNELSSNLGIAKQTVERYLDLLEKAFVIKKVTGFSRNLRKEIQKTARYYFFDNGIRNAVINNFNDIGTRNDVGELWENFLFMERLKRQHYKQIHTNNYFWRTYDRKEIDLVEERGGQLHGYEFKWTGKKRVPRLWLETYDNASFEMISRENFLQFIT